MGYWSFIYFYYYVNIGYFLGYFGKSPVSIVLYQLFLPHFGSADMFYSLDIIMSKTGYPKVRKGVLFAKRTPFREKDLISRKGPKKQVLDWFLLITLLC